MFVFLTHFFFLVVDIQCSNLDEGDTKAAERSSEKGKALRLPRPNSSRSTLIKNVQSFKHALKSENTQSKVLRNLPLAIFSAGETVYL